MLIFLFAGYEFASNSVVQKQFKLVILAIISVSVLPAVIEVVRARMRPKAVDTPAS